MKRLMMATAGLVICASAVHAQSPDALTEGKTSIAFSIPQSGSGSFGIWKQLSPTRALGIQATLQYGRHENDDTDLDRREFGISVAPAMKWYRALSPTVAPFIRGSAGVGYNSTEQQSGDIRLETDGFNVNASVGIGVDWFPLPSISIGGFTGLGAAFGRLSEGDSDRDSLLIGTNTSALIMHIYF